MAKKLAVTSEGFEDVVQEGNMGLFMCLTELCGCGDEIDVEKELLDAIEESMKAVSYTHLDVYKRQGYAAWDWSGDSGNY